MPDQAINNKQYKYILIALLLVTGFIIFKQMRPYLGGFLGAFTIYIILRGQLKYLVEKKKWNKGLAATALMFEALLLFLLPLTGIAILVVNKLSGISIDLDAMKLGVTNFLTKIETRFGFDIGNLDFLSFLPKLGTDLVQILAANSYSFIINFVVILFVLYFMLYSYREFENMIREVLPFNTKNKKVFIQETRAIIQANAIGIPLLAIIQGIIAYFGYLIFGVDSPIMYAILTAFASILPLVGTAIVYIPLSIGFFINDEYGAAIGLTLYGVLIIGSIDNVVRFILQKQLADIHPLITVFGVLLGIPLFGFWGVVFGPLILSLFMLFFDMYRYDYVPGSTVKLHPDKEKEKLDFQKIRNDIKQHRSLKKVVDNDEKKDENKDLQK